MKKHVFFWVLTLTILMLGTTSITAQLSFAPAKKYPIPVTQTDHVATGDFNQDGIADIVATTSHYATASVLDYKMLVYYGKTGVPDTTPIVYSYPQSGSGATSIAVADVTNDGMDDIILTIRDSIVIFAQNTVGFDAPRRIIVSGGAYLRCVKIADVDQDGNSDIVVSPMNSPIVPNYLAILYGDSTNTFVQQKSYWTLNVSGLTTDDLAVGTVGTDSLVSVVRMSGMFYPTIQLRIRKDRTVDYGVKHELPSAGPTYRSGLALGDYFGTGNNQIIVAYDTAIIVWMNSNSSTPDSIKNGGFSFIWRRSFEVGRLLGGLAPGRDQIITMGNDNAITVIDYVFGIKKFSVDNHIVPSADGICVADVSGDGKLDIIAANSSAGMSILINNTPSAQIASFYSNPQVIQAGESATLSWSTTNTASVSVSGGSLNTSALSGSISTGALYDTTTYTLTAYGIDTVQRTLTVIVMPPTDVHETKKDDIVVYPNPFSSVLYVELPEGKHTVYLMNTTGEIVQSRIGNKIAFNRGSLPAGMYTLCILMEKGPVYVKKIVAQ